MAFGDPHELEFKEFKELEKMADLLKDGEKRK
jgi:hypothetical protein